MDLLHNCLGPVSWPPRSCDIKTKVFVDKPIMIKALEAIITYVIFEILKLDPQN